MKARQRVHVGVAAIVAALVLLVGVAAAQVPGVGMPGPAPSPEADSVFVMTAGNVLQEALSTDPGNPRTAIPLTGDPAQQIQAMDFRPATGELYGIDTAGQLFLIADDGAVATAVGDPIAVPSEVAEVEFDPVTDLLRVIGPDLHVLVDPDTAVVTELDPLPAGVVALAASDPIHGTPTTTIWAVDATDGVLRRSTGGQDRLELTQGPAFDGPAATDAARQDSLFDIAQSGQAYLVGNSGGDALVTKDLVALDLSTGQGESVGQFAGNPTAFAVRPAVLRYDGDSRIATAARIAQLRYSPGVDAVYLADADSFADALAAGPAAAEDAAPILLTRGARLPEDTVAQLQRLQPARIVLVGGTARIPEAVAVQAGQYAPQVQRIAGTDRYATAAMLSAARYQPDTLRLFIATGESFPDALAAGPVATQYDSPVLLVRPDSIPDVVAEEIRRLTPQSIIVLGGQAAISDDVVDELAGYTDGSVERAAGPDRYDTAARVSERGTNVFEVFLATGATFPDALAVTPLAGRDIRFTLLTRPDSLPEPTRQRILATQPRRIVIVGGTGAVSHNVATQLEALTFPYR